MTDPVFYTIGGNAALHYAKEALTQRGFRFATMPDRSVSHLLLGVPSFCEDGTLKGGGVLEEILSPLGSDVTVVGGNLNSPTLSGYATIDLLQDPAYVAENADITAHCAVKLALQQLPATLKGCHILVLGWGRIGKCLSRLLRNMGAVVTIAARKEADRAILAALGYDVADICTLEYGLLRFRIIFNTVPEPVLDKDALGYCSEDCLKIDLASRRGMDAADAIWARGLPGKDAPETSGALIAKTILRHI